jgi:hypothetical protein
MRSNTFYTVYDNSLDAFLPEVWAAESLMILRANMVAASLVHRDFQNEIAKKGDVVNTRQPATFKAKRKGNTDDVTIQDASATNVPVTLNQHLHTSFLIRDGEESESFADLVETYLEPAILSIAQQVDAIVLGQVYQFMSNDTICGKLGTAPDEDTVIAIREFMNTQKVPMSGRQCIVTPHIEADLLSVTEFVEADKVGDNGSALREGALGRKFGINFYTCQNAPSIASGSTTVAYAVNHGAGYAAASVSITIDNLSADITAGSWCTIAGDMTPQRITAVSGSPTTSITISPGLKYAVVDDAVVTVYSPGAVNESDDYAAAYDKAIVVDGFTVAPKIGQLTSFGASASAKYAQLDTADSPATTSIELDRPLDAAISDNDAVGIGPAGDYAFAFHKNALALISRPLAAPKRGTGALSAVMNYKGVGIRVTITYNGTKQGHLVTVDLLCGVKVLNSALGGVMFG